MCFGDVGYSVPLLPLGGEGNEIEAGVNVPCFVSLPSSLRRVQGEGGEDGTDRERVSCTMPSSSPRRVDSAANTRREYTKSRMKCIETHRIVVSQTSFPIRRRLRPCTSTTNVDTCPKPSQRRRDASTPGERRLGGNEKVLRYVVVFVLRSPFSC